MRSIGDSTGGAKWQTTLPVLGLLLAATLWGVFWYPLRWLEQLGLGGLWQSFFIYSGTVWLMIVVVWRYRATLKAELGLAPWPLLFMALTSGWCNIAFILAMLDGHVMRVLLLFYLSPLWATLIGWLFLKEQLHTLSVVVLLVAVSGAVVMLWHPEMGYPWPNNRADWLALSAGMSFAILNALVRVTEQVSVPIKTVISWVGVLVISLVLIVLFGTGLPEVPVRVMAYAWLVGAIVMVIMTFSVVYGVTHMPIHRSSIILLFELVAGAVSSQLLTEEVITLHEWIGGAMVVAAAYLSARRQLSDSAGEAQS